MHENTRFFGLFADVLSYVAASYNILPEQPELLTSRFSMIPVIGRYRPIFIALQPVDRETGRN